MALLGQEKVTVAQAAELLSAALSPEALLQLQLVLQQG